MADMVGQGSKYGELQQGWPVVLAATIGSAAGLSSLPFYSLGSFIAPLQKEFGWGRGDVASSFLYTTLVLAATAPLLGTVIDRIGVRTVALVSIPLLSAVLFLISQFHGSVLAFHGLYALAAVVGGATTPINYTRAVNDAFDRIRGLALGISLAGIGVAAIALPLLLVGINQAYGWRTGYQTLAILALLPWPFVLLGIKRQALAGKLEPGRPAQPARSGMSGRAALQTGVFWTIGLAFMAIAIAVSALVVHMTPLLRDAGMSPVKAASTASIIGIGVLGGRVLIGAIIDRFFAPYVAATMFVATALGCVLLLTTGISYAPVAAVLIGFSLGAEVDLIAYLTARYFGMVRYGFVYAIIYSMFVVGAAIGPALAGAAFDRMGNYDSVLWSVITLLVGGAVAIACLPRFEAFAARRQAVGLPATQQEPHLSLP